MRRIYILFSLLAVILLSFTSCKKDDFREEESFIKIYNDVDGNKKFAPLSIQQTSDQGSLILSAYNGWNIFLMKTDLNGEIVWKLDVPSPYVSATPNLISFNGKYYFVCMDEVGLFSYIMEVNENSGSVSMVKKLNGMLYPTFAFSDGNTIYIQNYDRASNETGIHKMKSDLSAVDMTGSVDVMTSVLTQMVDHLMYSGKRYPFLVTSTNDQKIAMSCFYNYSFSLLFLGDSLEMTGVYNGAAYTGGVNALLPLSQSNQYAVARFSPDYQYFNPSVSLNTSAIDITENITSKGYPEIDPSKNVVVKELGVDGKSCIAMIGSTKSNQLLMQVFDKTSGTLLGTKYFGKNVPYTISDMVATTDGGALMLLQVKVMGNYQRIATIKLSNEQLKEVIGVE